MIESSNKTAVLEAPLPSIQQSPWPNNGRTLIGCVGRIASPLVVFAALSGLLLWGHHTGWTLPKFSSLAKGGTGEKDDWCSEHGVPESQCIECNSALMPRPKAFGWCKLHGVHECPLCHPEIAQTTTRTQATAAQMAKAKRALE